MPSTSPPELVILPARDGGEPWAPEGIREQYEALAEELERLDEKVAAADGELSGFLLQGNDGAGRDPADVGSSNFEHNQELSLTQNVREVADQARLALHLSDEGQHGLCKVCGNPIEKGKLQVFPRATTCVACKQREERR